MGAQDEVQRSRITLRYETEVNGELAPEELPFRQLVIGDFSGGTSKDRSVDLEERAVRSFDGNNTSDLIKDMGVKIDLTVPNKVDSEKEDLDVSISIDHKNSFKPNELAKQVPQIKALLMAKQLLLELQSSIANKKELGAMLNKLYADEDMYKKVKNEELKEFAAYQLPIHDKNGEEE